jgi:hypothetical protein
VRAKTADQQTLHPRIGGCELRVDAMTEMAGTIGAGAAHSPETHWVSRALRVVGRSRQQQLDSEVGDTAADLCSGAGGGVHRGPS